MFLDKSSSSGSVESKKAKPVPILRIVDEDPNDPIVQKLSALRKMMSNRDKNKVLNQTSFEERKKRQDVERNVPKQKGTITTDHNGKPL